MVLQWMLLRWTETRFRFLRWTLLTLPALPTRRGWRYLTAPFVYDLHIHISFIVHTIIWSVFAYLKIIVSRNLLDHSVLGKERIDQLVLLV